MTNTSLQTHTPNRRLFLGTQALALSAGAVALVGGHDAFAAGKPAYITNDLAILNVAVGLEHEGTAACAIALKSGLLNAQRVIAATTFHDDHAQHNDALFAAIRKLGGTPMEPKKRWRPTPRN